MSIQNKLKRIYQTLAGLNVPCHHGNTEPRERPPYIIWCEDGEASSLQSDGHKSEQCIDGWVQYFTAEEFDPMTDMIQDALNSIDGLYFRYESSVYGDVAYDDNGVINHSWYWRIL